MTMISFEDFSKLFDSIPGEPEFEILFRGVKAKYMIIKYDDHVSFQRCGVNDGSGEYDYPSLQELYQAVTVDGICLKDCWDTVENIIADSSFDLSVPDDVAGFKERWMA